MYIGPLTPEGCLTALRYRPGRPSPNSRSLNRLEHCQSNRVHQRITGPPPRDDAATRYRAVQDLAADYPATRRAGCSRSPPRATTTGSSGPRPRVSWRTGSCWSTSSTSIAARSGPTARRACGARCVPAATASVAPRCAADAPCGAAGRSRPQTRQAGQARRRTRPGPAPAGLHRRAAQPAVGGRHLGVQDRRGQAATDAEPCASA